MKQMTASIKCDVDHDLPVSIETRWFKVWDKCSGTSEQEYVHVITWADGTVREDATIPNDWLPILRATHDAKNDERLAQMSREHVDGRVGDVPVYLPQAAE
jgi:hypothetical protein